jgi:hypothetical protein
MQDFALQEGRETKSGWSVLSWKFGVSERFRRHKNGINSSLPAAYLNCSMNGFLAE